MLVLSRKTLQRIRIGDAVILTVVKIGGNTVRLGIEAPADVAVLREELLTGAELPADPADVPWAARVEFCREKYLTSIRNVGIFRLRYARLIVAACHPRRNQTPRFANLLLP